MSFIIESPIIVVVLLLLFLGCALTNDVSFSSSCPSFFLQLLLSFMFYIRVCVCVCVCVCVPLVVPLGSGLARGASNWLT